MLLLKSYLGEQKKLRSIEGNVIFGRIKVFVMMKKELI